MAFRYVRLALKGIAAIALVVFGYKIGDSKIGERTKAIVDPSGYAYEMRDGSVLVWRKDWFYLIQHDAKQLYIMPSMGPFDLFGSLYSLHPNWEFNREDESPYEDWHSDMKVKDKLLTFTDIDGNHVSVRDWEYPANYP